MRPPCFECGKPSVQDHHVVPVVYGGTRTVPLCLECHGKVHGKKMNHPELTRAGMAAYKARGGIVGAARPECRHNLDKQAGARARGGANAAAVHRRGADEAYGYLAPIIKAWHAEGLSSRTMAGRLNADEYTTREGKPWNHVQVLRILKRFKD